MLKNKRIWPILLSVFTLLLAGALVFAVLPSGVEAAASDDTKRELERLEREKKDLERELAELEKKLEANLNEMEKIIAQKEIIDQEIFNLHQKVVNINEQIAIYGQLIADKQEELSQAEAHLKELGEKNRERIRAMEEDGTMSYWSVLFEANSFSDFLDRLSMVEEIAASDQRRLEEMSKAAENVAKAKRELEDTQTTLQNTKLELEESQKVMEEKRKEADELLAQLIATGEEYEEYIAEKEKEESGVQDKIDDLEELYEWQKGQEEANNAPAPESGGGSWLKPTRYTRVSSPYGWRIHPVYGDRRFHNGVDLSASSGTPIYASRSGKVVIAQYSSSAGYYVTIDHQDGFQSKYLHMTHYIVSKGDYVTAGQVIGYVGSTGVSTGPHLHFTITYKGEYVNPANYINF